MPSSPPPLWDGYDDAEDHELIALLEEKARRAQDENDDGVDPVLARDFATAVASHERLKQANGDAGYRQQVHAVASEIAEESWRPH